MKKYGLLNWHSMLCTFKLDVFDFFQRGEFVAHEQPMVRKKIGN